MATEKTDNFIKELSQEDLDALRNLQVGLPEGFYKETIIDRLDERDLLTRIQYTSPRSAISIPGWALSDQGNQIVEELARIDREKERAEAGVPKAEKKAKKGDKSN